MGEPAESPSEVLRRQLRRWRDRRNLTAQGLADRIAEHGGNLTRVAISKIENDDRGVSLDEWLQLAHALAVPPPLLFLDLDSANDVALFPGIALHPWIAWEWVTGNEAPPVPGPDGGVVVSRVDEFEQAQRAIQLYRRESSAAMAMHTADSRVRSAEFTGDQEQLKAARASYVEALNALAKVLDEMIRNGMTPPGMPGEWVNRMRSIGLSAYPDRLLVYEA